MPVTLPSRGRGPRSVPSPMGSGLGPVSGHLRRASPDETARIYPTIRWIMPSNATRQDDGASQQISCEFRDSANFARSTQLTDLFNRTPAEVFGVSKSPPNQAGGRFTFPAERILQLKNGDHLRVVYPAAQGWIRRRIRSQCPRFRRAPPIAGWMHPTGHDSVPP